MIFSFIVHFFLLLGVFTSAQPLVIPQEDAPIQERQALMDLYRQCGGMLWNNHAQGWMSNYPVCDVWWGIKCENVLEDNNRTHVTSLDLRQNQLNCELPQSLGALAFLTDVDMTDARLGSPFPTVIQGWHRLRFLRLAGTQMYGTLPEWLGNSAPYLTDFSVTHLSGTIPDSLKNLPYLRDLSMNGNSFSGYLPSWLIRVPFWMMSGSTFSGPCPPYSWAAGHQAIIACAAPVPPPTYPMPPPQNGYGGTYYAGGPTPNPPFQFSPPRVGIPNTNNIMNPSPSYPPMNIPPYNYNNNNNVPSTPQQAATTTSSTPSGGMSEFSMLVVGLMVVVVAVWVVKQKKSPGYTPLGTSGASDFGFEMLRKV